MPLAGSISSVVASRWRHQENIILSYFGLSTHIAEQINENKRKLIGPNEAMRGSNFSSEHSVWATNVSGNTPTVGMSASHRTRGWVNIGPHRIDH